MPNRGQLAILVVALLAVGMAGFAWWFRYQQSVRVMEFWGTDAAQLIRQAKQLDVYRVSREPPADDGVTPRTIEVLGDKLFVSERKDISEAVGLIHVRHFLVKDASFDWGSSTEPSEPNWEYALDFVDSSNIVTIVFDLRNERICYVQQQRQVSISPMAGAIGKFVKRQFADPASSDPADDKPENPNER